MLNPYPETKVDWLNRATGTLVIRTPWIEVEAEVPIEADHEIDQAMRSLNNYYIESEARNVRAVHYFLEQFQNEPISYITPRKITEFADINPVTLPPHDFLLSQISSCKIGDCSQLEEDVLTKSRIEGSKFYDAQTVVGLLRRQRLIHLSSSQLIQNQIENLIPLKDANRTLYIAIMRRILQHAWYITNNAVGSLSGALSLNPVATPMLLAYIRSEAGHDLLVKKSFKDLGGDISQLGEDLFSEVVALIDLLKTSASVSLLTLAALIEGFEGIHFDEDPMNIWTLLDGLDEYPNAARGVTEHQRINEDQNHANVGLELASVLPPVTEEEVLLAVRVSEGSEQLRSLLFQKLYSSIGLE